MTLEELQARKAAYMAAELKILESQEYKVGDGVANRSNRRADLEQVRDELKVIDQQIEALTARTSGRRRVYYGRPG
ncbi:hypothetical protein [Methylibium sp.]|uniref:hypothetical protein n=1 Tax=Methylibium sp. TaxID=2067992 RepID=UPI003D131471